MKSFWFIGAIFVLMLAGCNRPSAETRRAVSPRPELAAVDSLMWSRPDSAFAMLLEFADSPVADSLDAFNGHYCQLLVSELLYKNDYEQTNREELLKAVDYFDSIGDVFLDARAHYIKGVGFYEMDSVVEACEEYLKALEVMEDHYDEKELVGDKAKFMALAYTHLCQLFSDQYLHEQAIYFGKQSLFFYDRYASEPWYVAWILNNIGSNYEMMGALDSADYYHREALHSLNDTITLLHRDITTHLAFISYQKEGNPEHVVDQMRYLVFEAESEREYLSRCAVLAEVFYHEKNYDSAWVYLNRVFEGNAGTDSKIQAAKWLMEICQMQNRSVDAQVFSNYLAQFATREENHSNIKSRLAELYGNHGQRKTEQWHQLNRRKHTVGTIAVVAGLLFVILALYVLYRKSRKKKLRLEERMKEERMSHEIWQKALGGRLKRSNESLLELKTKIKRQENEEEREDYKDIPFEEEPICKHILQICNDERNPIKANMPLSSYADMALTVAQEAQLRKVAVRHHGRLFERLKKDFPALKSKDYLYCYLCLLDLDNAQIAVLTHLSYRTVWEREKRLQRIFGCEDKIVVILKGFV